jgi:hypothetical protein
VVASQGVVGYRVKSATGDALYVDGRSKGVDPTENLASRTPRESQQQDAFGLDASFE